MLLSAVSVLVVAQSSSEVPEGLMNNPVYLHILLNHNRCLRSLIRVFVTVQNYVVCFLLGDAPASEMYMLTFRNTLFHLHRQVVSCTFYTHLPAYEDGTDRVFRNVGI